jgi:hypothetical protein
MVPAERKERTDARKAFEKALEISPDYLPALERLVGLDLTEAQYATAMDRVNEQIEKNPKVAQLWVLQARIYIAQQDISQAEPAFLKAIKTGAIFCRLFPLDKQKNAQGQRAANGSLMDQPAATVSPAPCGMAPLLQKLIQQYATTGLRPAYLPKPLVDSPRCGPLMNKKLLSLYSLKFDPFSPEVPLRPCGARPRSRFSAGGSNSKLAKAVLPWLSAIPAQARVPLCAFLVERFGNLGDVMVEF